MQGFFSHKVVWFCFFLLRPPTKPGYRDVTMHAQYFFWGRELKHSNKSVLPVSKKEWMGKGKWTIGPRMKNGRANSPFKQTLNTKLFWLNWLQVISDLLHVRIPLLGLHHPDHHLLWDNHPTMLFPPVCWGNTLIRQTFPFLLCRSWNRINPLVQSDPPPHIGQFYPKRRNNAKCWKPKKIVRLTLIDVQRHKLLEKLKKVEICKFYDLSKSGKVKTLYHNCLTLVQL